MAPEQLYNQHLRQRKIQKHCKARLTRTTLKILVVAAAILLILAFSPHSAGQNSSSFQKTQIKLQNKDQNDGLPEAPQPPAQEIVPVSVSLKSYLNARGSPLAPDTDYLLTLPNWKRLVAISSIESQFCKRQRNYNCWGIKSGPGFRVYSSFRAAAQDANDFLQSWFNRGKWLTVHSMNGSYVVPYSQNWENVVNSVLKDMDQLEQQSQGGTISASNPP